jgi:hypothetical protein
MRFTVLPGQPVVDVEPDRRTGIDHRVKLLDHGHTLRTILERAEYRFEPFAEGKWYIHGLKSVDGEDWNVAGDHPAMVYVVPKGGAVYPGQPAYLIDTVDGGARETSSKVFTRLVTKNRKKELDRYRVTKPPKQGFTAVRSGGRRAIGGTSFQQIARQVAPKQPDLENGFESVLIQAVSLSVASEALERDDFPEAAWVANPLQHTFWPKQRWHDQALSATDSAPIRAYEKRQRRQAEQAIEAEVRAFRDELSARQRA